MPVMNGVELLKTVKEISPDTVQIMLTGQADMNAVIDLINKGGIFRFLTKPCEPDDLIKNINDGIRQYELITAERDLMGKTLGGSIRVLTDLLALAKPQAFHRAQRIRSYIKRIMPAVKVDNYWQFEIAAMLSQIGCVTIPDEILIKAFGGRMLTDYELIMFQNHPLIAADMIQNIPRMGEIAEIIRYQEKLFNGTGVPIDDIRCKNIPM
jgi:response regulator RpfG family c-di-GMP phosphodiesterase